MKPNIALAGNMYAGKSTIADALTESGYQRMSFAAPLKNVAALAYGQIDKSATYEVIDTGKDGDEIGIPATKSGRQILQEVGQFMKHVDRDFWIKCFMREAARYEDTPLVVDDLRFLFEMRHLLDDNWFIVGVDTPEETRKLRARAISGRYPTEAEMNHESERDVQTIIKLADFVVTGTGDPYNNAAAILEAYDKRDA